jgi:hypothetical protein
MLLVSVAGAAGCTAEDRRAEDRSSAFCVFLTALNAKANSVSTPQDGLAMLQSSVPELEIQRSTAPEHLRPDIAVVLAASKKAIESSDLGALATDEVAQAGARLSAACGIAPPSVPDATNESK